MRLIEDGTYIVDVSEVDLDEIKRVMLVMGNYCTMMYPDSLPSAEPEQRWIPCSERLPEDLSEVNVTWINTDPVSYYDFIKGKRFTGSAVYYKGKWYWYSSTTEDMLAEYGRYDSEEFDEAIECIAWMPLPEPWRGEVKNES